MKKVRLISVSKTGLKYELLDINYKTMALLILSNEKDANILKMAYEKRMSENGFKLNHEKDIHYKKPFWKFWGMKDYSIAVYKLKFDYLPK